MDGLLTGTSDAVVEAIVRQSTELGGYRVSYRGGSGAPGIKLRSDRRLHRQILAGSQHGDDPKVAHGFSYKAFTRKDASPNTCWG